MCPAADNKLVQQRFKLHVCSAYAQHVFRKVIDILRWNPRRSQSVADVAETYGFRLNDHQVLYVLLIVWIVFGSRTGFFQLLTDIAGKIGVAVY